MVVVGSGVRYSIFSTFSSPPSTPNLPLLGFLVTAPDPSEKVFFGLLAPLHLIGRTTSKVLIKTNG